MKSNPKMHQNDALILRAFAARPPGPGRAAGIG